MNLDIKNIKIKNFLGQWNIDWNLKKVNVLVGKNGSGKTKLLELIKYLIEKDMRETDGDKFELLCNDIKISFVNGLEIGSHYIEDSKSELREEMKKIFMENVDSLKKEIYSKVSKEEFDEEKMDRIANKLLEDIKKKIEANRDIPIGNNSLLLNKKLQRVFSKKNPAILGENFNFKDNLSVMYLSTISMSANAANIIKKSTGNKSTVLDMEIEDEISNLVKKENIAKFIEVIDSFFSDTGKRLILKDERIYVLKNEEELLKISDLSSGEKQLIFIFLKLISVSDKKTLILMDEPEISLHLKWQENLIKSIRSINSENQLIIVTHSPAIIMNGWLDSYIDIEKIRVEV